MADPVFELLDTDAEVAAEGGEVVVKVNSNFDYTVVAADAWVSVGEKTGTGCTLVVEANADKDSRMATVLFDGNQQFYIVQAGAVSEDDPFNVGSDLSIHGTANCYVVTKAGSYTFDASVMGNGEDGYDLWDESQLEVLHLWPKTQAAVSFKSSVYSANTKPRTVEVLWDDNNVIDGEPTMSNMVVSFKATGNKGNALLATRNRSGDICWSWHIWCTDSPKQKRMYDLEENEYALLDRNLGATSADAADGDKTWGLYYQFGRKDPLKGYVGIAADLQESQENVYESIKNPTAFYGMGSKTAEWFNTGPNLSFVTADLWGNPSYKWQANQDFPVPPHDFPASRSELKKTIYDPCPPGYMVPPPMAWEMITKNDLRVTDDGVYMPTFDGESFYPFAGFLSPLNTTEMGYEYTLGWFAFKGMRETTWARRSTHTVETVVAAVYTSQTGSYDWWVDTHGQWEMFGGSYIEAYIEESDPVTFENLRFKLGHRVRVYGYPVRCVKEFND